MEKWFDGDWLILLRGTQVFLQGGNPYAFGFDHTRVYNPFWTFIILAPFTLIPYHISRFIAYVISLASYAYVSKKMGAKLWQTILFILSWPIMAGLIEGNIDWIVLLGLLMPPWLGLFFLSIKPQIGIGVAIFWAYTEWRDGGIWKVVRTFGPVLIAHGVGHLLYSPWPFSLLSMKNNQANISIFPILLYLGIYVLMEALDKKDIHLSLVSGHMLAPYVTLLNYCSVLLGLVTRPKVFIIAWILLWTPAIIKILL